MQPLVFTRDQVRAVDRISIEDFAVPGIVLMENAARGAASLLLDKCPSGHVVIVCGIGNNGGDGFAIARHLANHGLTISIVTVGDSDRIQGDAAINFEIVRRMQLPIQALGNSPGQAEFNTLVSQFQQADWIVDALLGTGTNGEARSPFFEVIDLLNQSGKPVLAVDIPSGMDCDQGPIPGKTVRAAMTATFVAYKPGFLAEGANEYLGTVQVIEIGQPTAVLRRILGTST